jgi:hypothetical protein
MAYQSTHRLQEDMDRVEQELEAALVLERAAKDRHAEEGLPETEAVLEARRTRTAHLRKERVGFLEELRRRAVKEKGWKPDAAEDTGTDGAPARSPGCGRAGRLRIGPHPLLPERGYLLRRSWGALRAQRDPAGHPAHRVHRAQAGGERGARQGDTA